MRIRNHSTNHLLSGFTLVELMVVVAVIGTLASITTATYRGAQQRARDASVQSDVDNMDASQTNLSLRDKSAGKEYYSVTDGVDVDLGFTPSKDNIIDVVINETDYCIRGYNPRANKNSITNAYTKESTQGVCALLEASPAARGL